MISGLRRLAGGALRVLALVLASSAANADTVLIATTDWPPYTTPARPDQGASSAVLRAAFQAVGHEVRFEFLPWARAVHEGTQGSRAAGYFPAYESAERSRLGLRSARIGSSQVGFAHRADKPPPSWSSLDELAGRRIGVVRDYVNSEDFDTRMRDGRLKTEAAASDEENLRKLVGARIDLAVVDRAVFHALLVQHALLGGAKLQFDPQRLLEEKGLYVYFRRDAQGERWLRLLDQGLERIDARAVFQQALAGPN